MKNRLSAFLQNIKAPLETDMEQYKKLLEKIDSIKLDTASDHKLKELSTILKDKVHGGAPEDELLPEAFALAREAAKRVLGLRPFDVQVLAGICMHKGKLVEMQTGEGKTLAAVLPAYLNALAGRGVHILTFNDYLAHRDAQWMGPIYRFLGLEAGYIREGMSTEDRQKAYSADITYVTAKEAGFDYLRDFLCMEKEKLVHREFNYAIVDEADSILIDEARIPLVIAGAVRSSVENSRNLADLVRRLKREVDFEIDENGRNIYLTEEGLVHAEKLLGCGNLYLQRNLELLTGLNCALHAEFLLERDKDYIVRNGKIEIVDEFTGRIADKRHWPDKLQEAVSAKEGVSIEAKGMIMGSITLQHFLSLYPKLAGMTGTAKTAAAELKDFYCMDVAVIPTNRPCIRLDHPERIFRDREAKQRALVSEIRRINKTGRPVLIGTGSVEESERLAADLEAAEINCRVLNARNDEMEARIIARAGEPGAVTVSTNMAGRGVDIKLGGEKEQHREKVAALGGLYVIGTGLNESRRIDNQLKGRAGRQGDPGESRIFISLEDELIQKYGIARLPAVRKVFEKSTGEIDAPDARKAILSAQKIIEGYNSDLRLQLAKYSYLIEQQRRIIHDKRQNILTDRVVPKLLSEKAPEKYSLICSLYGDAVAVKVEKQLILYNINKCWADYLDYISYVREGIHLVSIAKKEPLHEYNKIAVEAFEEMLENIESGMIETFNAAEITEAGMDMGKEGLEVPSSTWTYLINDSPEQFSNLQHLLKAASNYINKPLFTLRSIYKKLHRQ